MDCSLLSALLVLVVYFKLQEMCELMEAEREREGFRVLLIFGKKEGRKTENWYVRAHNHHSRLLTNIPNSRVLVINKRVRYVLHAELYV